MLAAELSQNFPTHSAPRWAGTAAFHLSGNDFSGSDLFDPCGFLHGRIDGEHALDAQGVSA